MPSGVFDELRNYFAALGPDAAVLIVVPDGDVHDREQAVAKARAPTCGRA